MLQEIGGNNKMQHKENFEESVKLLSAERKVYAKGHKEANKCLSALVDNGVLKELVLVGEGELNKSIIENSNFRLENCYFLRSVV